MWVRIWESRICSSWQQAIGTKEREELEMTGENIGGVDENKDIGSKILFEGNGLDTVSFLVI